MISKKIKFLLGPLALVLAVGLSCSSEDDLTYRGTCNDTSATDLCLDFYGGSGDVAAAECPAGVTISKNMCTGAKSGTCEYKKDNEDAEFRLTSGDAQVIADCESDCTNKLSGTWTPAGG